MNAPVLELANVCRSYPGPAGAPEVAVLRNVDFALGAGESAAIVGPSGSGKSTLLNLMGALDRPTSGTVRIDGRDLAGLPEPEAARLRNRTIGFVFQRHHLLPQLDALENVLVPVLAEQARASDAEVARAKDLLDRVGLAGRTHHRPGELSGGECQRIAVARALIRGPRLVLADEPTGSLDAATADEVADLLATVHRAEGAALVVVTHAPALARRMQRAWTLEGGRLIAGPAAERTPATAP